jgi:hypothetical protein
MQHVARANAVAHIVYWQQAAAAAVVHMQVVTQARRAGQQ